MKRPPRFSPKPANDSYSILHDHTLSVGEGLRANDSDMDGDPLSITAINGNAYTPGQALLTAAQIAQLLLA